VRANQRADRDVQSSQANFGQHGAVGKLEVLLFSATLQRDARMMWLDSDFVDFFLRNGPTPNMREIVKEIDGELADGEPVYSRDRVTEKFVGQITKDDDGRYRLTPISELPLHIHDC
jgi:hypothetical protein